MNAKLKLLHTTTLLIALLGMGCATQPVPTVNARPVPAERIVATELLSPSETRTVSVTVKRDRGLTGAAVKELFSIDGREVARLGPSEKIVIYLKPGRYVFGIYPIPNLFKTHTTEETEAVIEEDRAVTYRIYIAADMISRIERTAF